MKKNPLGIITHNLSYKVISLLIAIVIWYAVVYASDPQETESFNVKVQVLNETYIANGKQVYSIDDEYKQVTVYVRGNRSELNKLSADSISVTADLTQIVDLERDPVTVPLDVSCRGFDRSALSLSRSTIPIVIENIARKEFPVVVSTGETVPGKDYEIGKLTPNPDSVVINGPESIVNSIDTVVARIDVSNMTFDRTKNATLILRDRNQNEISETIINDDLTFDGGMPEIKVAVELWRKVSGVTFELHYSGDPNPGYMVGTLTSVPEEITLAGTSEAIQALAVQGNVLVVPQEKIVLTGEEISDTTFVVDITDLIPSGMKLSSSAKNTITVTVPIMPFGSKTYTLDVDEITVTGLADNRTVSYDQAAVELRVQGAMEDLRGLEETIRSATIDVTGLAIGDYQLPIEVQLPDGCSLVNDVIISVHIKEKAVR